MRDRSIEAEPTSAASSETQPADEKAESSSPSAGGQAPRKKTFWSRQKAYNLVVLTVTVTLLNVWVASVTPLWSTQIKRDKEAELIFRGLQYAEAIRLFQLRNGRAPTNLKELIEVQPRCIRQLWPNPMREDGRWGLIPAGLTQGQPGQPGQPVQPAQSPGQTPTNLAGNDEGLGADPFGRRDGEEGAPPGVILSAKRDEDGFGTPPSSVPIRGVFSPTNDESILTFLGKSSIREWQFTADLFATMKQGTPDNPALVTPFLAKEIGKPWPPGVVPQVPQPSDKPARPASNQPGGGRGATLGGNRPLTEREGGDRNQGQSQGQGQGQGGPQNPGGGPNPGGRN